MRVQVRVPATSANLGPGFDSLGVALRLYNTIEVEDAEETRPGPEDPFLSEIRDAYARRSGRRARRGAVRITGDVPASRGLGSSVTVRLGVLHGLNGLHPAALPREAIYELACELEGHPDNAAPAEYGGFTVCRPDGRFQRFTVGSQLHFVLLIPEISLPTKKARAVLPQRVPRLDAVRSAAAAANICAAFASRNYAALADSFFDGLHQPYRRRLLPILDAVIDAGRAAGALGGWLSGAGSTIACVTLERPEAVAVAMRQAAGELPCSSRIVGADNSGARIRIFGDSAP